MSNALFRFQEWFAKSCNGSWEHDTGVTIASLDNPGWAVDIDLVGTAQESFTFDQLKVDRTSTDWFTMYAEDGFFRIRCGPRNLEECLGAFCIWADG